MALPQFQTCTLQLGGLEKLANGSVYSRIALGHYSIEHIQYKLLKYIFIFLHNNIGKDCSQWPFLASYNLVDKQFTCDGSITNFMLCNRRHNTFLGLSLRKNASGTLDVRVQEAYLMLKHRLIFSGGDQLMFTVIYYPSGGTNTVDTVSGYVNVTAYWYSHE